jgi:hypothetical protein
LGPEYDDPAQLAHRTIACMIREFDGDEHRDLQERKRRRQQHGVQLETPGLEDEACERSQQRDHERSRRLAEAATVQT